MSSFPILFTLIKIAYVAINLAGIVRLHVALRGRNISRYVRNGACLLAVVLSLCFPLARLIESHGFWARAVTFAGMFWFVFMFHALMAWGALGVFRLFNRRFGWLKIAPEAREQWRHRCCAGIVCAALLVCLGGAINMQFPVVREVKLPAPAGAGPLRIVALSDLHLGRLAGTRFLSGAVGLIEPLKPDIVVFLGDILEYDFDPSEIEANAAVLRRLNPRLGIWGVMGNHEHIGEKGKLNMRYLNEMGIRMLADQWTVLEEVWGRHADGGKILLIGQQDRYAWQNPLEKTLANAPKDAALKLLLVHQPFNLWEAEKAGINLQLSGHTHNGQFFPLNFAAKILFENPYGHSMRGQTHYWVTSGIGTWGQRIRTSNRPEIVQIDLVP